MNGIRFEVTCAPMTVQAQQVLESAPYMDCAGWRAHILHINTAYPLEFVLQRTIDGVIGVAGVTGGLHWHSVVLKVCGRNVVGIVDVEALAVARHGVAGNTKLSLFGTLDVCGHASADAEKRQNEEGNEDKNFLSRANRPDGANEEEHRQDDGEDDESDQDFRRSEHETSRL